MTPILQNLGAMIFLLTAESGILINNFSRNVSRTRDDVYNAALGYDVGFVSYNPQAEYSIKGRVTAGTGLAAAAPGIALTVANLTYGNGVGTNPSDAGGVYTNTVGLDHAEKQFRELTIAAIQKPGIA
jgi:hypothetical protein